MGKQKRSIWWLAKFALIPHLPAQCRLHVPANEWGRSGSASDLHSHEAQVCLLYVLLGTLCVLRH